MRATVQRRLGALLASDDRSRRTVVALTSLFAVAVALAWPGAVPAVPPAPGQLATNLQVRCPQLSGSNESLAALAELYRRTQNENNDNDNDNDKGNYLPVQTAAAAAELQTFMSLVRRGLVESIELVPSTNAGRTPDAVVRFRDEAGVLHEERLEIKTVTGRKRGFQPRHAGSQPLRPASKRDIKRALRNGFRNPNQLTAGFNIHRTFPPLGVPIPPGFLPTPPEGTAIPPGGRLAINLPRGISSPGAIENAMSDLAKELNDEGVHVREIEFTRLSDAPKAEGRWVTERYVRTPDGTYTKIQSEPASSGPPCPLPAPRSPAAVVADPPGGAAGAGALPDAVQAPQRVTTADGTGGIDFSSLELRYVADTGRGSKRSLSYAFRGRLGTTPPDGAVGLGTSLQASDAFFVWLALPPSSFWVNLNPTEPDRIIDPQFARSDAGRVLLEADLLMKKVVAPLVHPDSPTGTAFWKELGDLYGNVPDARQCMSFRMWIVPAPATVRSTGRELYILDAPLDVKMESQYLGTGTAMGDCPMDAPALNAAKQELYHRLILPHVQAAVNTDASFAPLRRVYLSRIAAEWFRQRARTRSSAVRRIVNSGRIDRWIARPAWNPLEVFNRYVTSVRDGEFRVERTTQYGNQTYTSVYVYGGVDFARTPMQHLSAAAFKASFPAVARHVRRSLQRPALDAERGEVWLGGTSGGP